MTWTEAFLLYVVLQLDTGIGKGSMFVGYGRLSAQTLRLTQRTIKSLRNDGKEQLLPALHSSSSEDQFQHLLIFCGVMASLVMKKHNYYLETLLFLGCQDNKDRGWVQTICCFSCFLPLQKGKVFKDSASPMALAWERYTCGRPRNTHRLGGICWISCGVSEVDRGSGKPWTNKNMNHKGWNQSGKWNYPIPQRQERVSQGSHRHLYSCTSQVIAITS